MKATPSRITSLLASVFFAAALASSALGCAATPSASGPPPELVAPEITRTTAISVAQSDALLRFRELTFTDVAARRQGGFWVVELRSPTGSGLRYAIAGDGTIRERNVFQ